MNQQPSYKCSSAKGQEITNSLPPFQDVKHLAYFPSAHWWSARPNRLCTVDLICDPLRVFINPCNLPVGQEQFSQLSPRRNRCIRCGTVSDMLRISVPLELTYGLHNRIIIYSLRASEAHSHSQNESHSITQYWQTTFLIGYISILGSCVSSLQCVLVDTTLPQKPTQTDGEAGKAISSVGQSENSSATSSSENDIEDDPKARTFYRRLCAVLAVLSWNPILLGVVAGVIYTGGEAYAAAATVAQALR